MTKSLMISAALVVALVVTVTAAPARAASSAAWSPAASERLIKLPGHHLKKAVDNDFSKSALAGELLDTEERLRFKAATLVDLKAAVVRADGDTRVELEHEFLAEKRRYIELMAEHQELRRRQAETKVRLYENLLRRLNRDRTAMTPMQAQLIAKQAEAKARLEATSVQVDRNLFRSSMSTESRYAREYAKNVAAIESLTRAIQTHPMNEAPEIEGQSVTQADYLRQLVANNEAVLAIVEQENSVLGHMAKLVALDALALAEGIGGDPFEDQGDGGTDTHDPVTSVINLFVTQ